MIRIADPKDYDDLMNFAREMHADNGNFPMSEEKVSDVIALCLKRERGVIVLIESEDVPKTIEASACFVLEQHWYTDAWAIGDRWIYVRSLYRASNHAENLINFGLSLKDRWGLPLVLGVFAAERTEAKMRLYGRKMKLIGGLFVSGL